MPSYNKVILAGHITRDPELRFLPNGTAVVKFGLAMNRTWTQDGQKKEEVTFVDIDAFGKTAETIGQYLKKGSAILCDGRLKIDAWQDKQSGQNRSKLGVILESFTFLDSGERNGSTPKHSPRARSYPDRPSISLSAPDPKTPVAEAMEEGDVPF